MDGNLFKQIFDNIPQAVWIKDTDSVYIAANKSCAKVCQIKQEDFPGKTDFDLFPDRPELAEKYRKDDAYVIRTKQKVEFDEDSQFEGKPVIVHAVKAPILDIDNTTVLGVMGIAWNISKYKHLQSSLQEEKQNLERSNKDLESFAYMASHDLQEPLRTVANYLQILDKKCSHKLEDKERKYIHLAINGAKNMKKLIDLLLGYSRAASQKPDFKNFDPNRMMTDIKKSLSVAITKTNARIHVDKLPSSIYGDPTQIELVIQNIMHNAIKYKNSDRMPQIRVNCLDNETEHMFSIQDNGPGIDPSNHKKVFLGFRQFGHGKDGDGVGLGLAICKKIIERHKGKIWVKSEINKGATFYFTIKKQEYAN